MFGKESQMPLLLLKNLKYLPYILIFFAGFYVSSQISGNKLTRALAAQEQQFNTLMIERQQKEKEASDAYQAKISALSGNAAKLRKLYERRCYTVSAPTSRPDGSTSTGELPRTYAIDAGELIDIGEDAEKVRLQLIALQDFINGK
jgi:hypothetical protein